MTPPDSTNPSPSSPSTPVIPPLGAVGAGNLATFLALQLNTAGALAAAGQKMLEGMREITREQMMLQAALLRQVMGGWASFADLGAPESMEDTRLRQANAATEATLDSMRRIMNTACRCSMDALGAFQEHMTGTQTESSSAPAGCHAHEQRSRSAA